MDLIILLFLFVLGGVVGNFFEVYVRGTKKRRILDEYVPCKYIPFLPMYAFGLVFLYIISKFGPSSTIITALIAMVILTIFECVTGLIIKKTQGKRGWNYFNHHLNGCDGHISLKVSSLWFAASLVAIFIFRRYLNT